MKLIVDTNIFLEVMLGQERAAECRTFLNWLAVRKDGVISSFTIHAIEAIAGRTLEGRKALRIFFRLLRRAEFEIYSTSLDEEEGVLEITRKMKLDFDDGIQYFVTEKYDGVLVSFDKDFDRTDIPRLTPHEAFMKYK